MTGVLSSAAARCAALNCRLEELAADGAWQEIAAAVRDRDALVSRLPAAERGNALLAARRCTERLQALARAAKSQCAEELATLQRGRRATASYRAHR